MSDNVPNSKRQRVDPDPDVIITPEEDVGDTPRVYSPTRSEKRSKRDKGIGGGLQAYTKYVCEKLSQVHKITNTEIAEVLVKEHTTGDAKKNDNIRRRVYDALSVIHAIGLAEKRGKTFFWVGMPAIPQARPENTPLGKLKKELKDRRTCLIRLIRRAVGLEYLRQKRREATTAMMSSINPEYGGLSPGGYLCFKPRTDEVGEFQLPLLVLGTDPTSRMLMETDASYSEVYIKISKSYQLKSSDSVLTELGYDDVNRLDTPVANCLLQTLIRSHIPKDIIEEALNLKISDSVYNPLPATMTHNEVMQAVLDPMPPATMTHNEVMQAVLDPMPPATMTHNEVMQAVLDPIPGEVTGLDAIVSAAQRLNSNGDTDNSMILPSFSQDLPMESYPV